MGNRENLDSVSNGIMALLAIALGLAATILALPCTARADEAADSFKRLYGEDLKRVVATVDLADDVLLAAKFLTAAQHPNTAVVLAAVLFEKAHELGSKHASGSDTAVKAMLALAERTPDKRIECLDRIIALRERQYRAATGPGNAGAAELLIDALLAGAEANALAGKGPEAAALGRKAIKIASQGMPERVDEVSAYTARQAKLLRSGTQLAGFKASLNADPKDQAARVKALRLSLVELDDPAQAAFFLDDSSDTMLRKYVQAAAKGLESAPAEACRELGSWYFGLACGRTGYRAAAGSKKQPGAADPGAGDVAFEAGQGLNLADGASVDGKAAMLMRAWMYYQRFLRLHREVDVAWAQVKADVERVEKSMDALHSSIGLGPWQSLLEGLDIRKHAIGGRWGIDKDGVLRVTTGGGNNERIVVPWVPQGSYEIRFRLNRRRNANAVAVILQVGQSRVVLIISHGNVDKGELADAKGGQRVLSSFTVENEKYYDVAVKVFVNGNQGEIDVTLDGKPYLYWHGPQSALSENALYKLSPPRCLGLGIHMTDAWFADPKIRSIKGRILPMH